MIEKLQGWFSRFLEVLWWYINPSKMYKLIITWSIQIYSWSFSWNNKRYFSTRANIYNTRQFNVFKTRIPTLSRCKLNSIPYKAKQLWDLLPENLKSSPSLTVFRNEMKLFECFKCPFNIWKIYVTSLGYCVLRNQFFSWVLTDSYLSVRNSDLKPYIYDVLRVTSIWSIRTTQICRLKHRREY